MGGFDPAKILVVLLVALVVLGPERLPRAARQLGTAWRELTRIRERVEEEVRSAMPDVDLPKLPAMPRTSVAGYLTGMMTNADRARGTGGGTGSPADAEVSAEEGVDTVSWSGSTAADFGAAPSNPSPVISPAGIPAGWQSPGSHAPGYASGSLLSPVPTGAPDGLVAAEATLDLADPSWN